MTSSCISPLINSRTIFNTQSSDRLIQTDRLKRDLNLMMKTDTERARVSYCVRWMGVAILLAVLFAAKTSAVAGAISITSPDQPQTFTYGEMIWHQLYLERRGQGLLARITFSNLPYADS